MPFRQSLAILLAAHAICVLSPAAPQIQSASAQISAVAQTQGAAQIPAAAAETPAASSPIAAAPVAAPAQSGIDGVRPQVEGIQPGVDGIQFGRVPATGHTPAAQPFAGPMVQSLKIMVLQGQRAVNDTARHLGVQPVVEVRDDNDRPVEGANVIFRLPPDGPGGVFDGKAFSKNARTNAQGQAGVTGFSPNSANGRFDIHVTALLGNRMGQTVINQTNAQNHLVLAAPPPRKKGLWMNKYVLIAAGAAIAAGVAMAITHSSSKQGVTITPGPVTINQ